MEITDLMKNLSIDEICELIFRTLDDEQGPYIGNVSGVCVGNKQNWFGIGAFTEGKMYKLKTCDDCICKEYGGDSWPDYCDRRVKTCPHKSQWNEEAKRIIKEVVLNEIEKLDETGE